MKKILVITLFIAICYNMGYTQDVLSDIDCLSIRTNEILIDDTNIWWDTYQIFSTDEETPIACKYLEFNLDSKLEKDDKVEIIINDVIYDSYQIDSTIAVYDTTYFTNNVIDHIDTICYDTIIDIPLVKPGRNVIYFGDTNRNINPYFMDVNYVYNIEIFAINEKNYNSDNLMKLKELKLIKDNDKKKIKKRKRIILPFFEKK